MARPASFRQGPDRRCARGSFELWRVCRLSCPLAKISVRFCIRPSASGCGWILRRLAEETPWTKLVALLNTESTAVERLLIFRSAPDKDFYISPKCEWLKSGIELRDLRSFCEVVRSVRSAQRKRLP